MARSALALALTLSMACASPAAARLLWQDTAVGTSSGGTADDVVTTGKLVFAGGKIPIRDHSEALLRAYDAASGALRWEDQPHLVDASEGITALAEADGRVFATVAARRFTFSSDDWVVRAFDASSGILVWEHRHDGPQARATDLVAADGRLFVVGRIGADDGTPRTVTRAYDAATGALLWEDRDDPGAFFLSEAVVVASGGRVFVGSQYPPGSRVRALDAASGDRLWSTELTPGSSVALATAGDRLFVSAPGSGKGGTVRAYDVTTGEPRWQIALAPRVPRERGAVYDIALAASDEALYVGTTRVSPESSDLAAYDAATGDTLWSVDGSAAAWGLTRDRGRLYAAPALHGFAVHVFDAATGTPRWRSTRTEPGRTLAVTARDGIAFVAGFVGPPLQSFHVAAFDGSRGFSLRPIVPGGPRLPITR